MSETREFGTHLGTVERQVLVDGEWVRATDDGEALLVEVAAFADDEPLPPLADAPVLRGRGRPRKS